MQYDENAEKYGYEGEMTPLKCDELKAFRIIQGDTGGYGAPSYKCDTDGNRIEEWPDVCEVYDRFEADKLIAEKDAEIARLNDKALQYKVLDKEHCRDLNTQERRFALQIAHHKYKRCLAIAQEWRNYAAFCRMQSHCHNHRGFGKTAEKWTWKECHAWRCFKRWLELAEKFKEAK